MNSSLVDAVLSFITGALLIILWMLGAYIVEGAQKRTDRKSHPMLDVYKGFQEDSWLKRSSLEDRLQAPVQPSQPTRPETMGIVKDADTLVERVYEVHSEIGVLTDEIK